MSFWQIYEGLCEEKGISPSGAEMVNVTGVSSAGITYWKQKNAAPKDFKIYEKLAKFFEVDIRYLMGLSEYRYGEDIIEEMTDKLTECGVTVDSYDDDNGIGKEYILTYENQSFNYQEHDFGELCKSMRSYLNMCELESVEKFCKKTFLGDESAETSMSFIERILFNEEEQRLLNNYRKLTRDGKTIVDATIIQEIRRQE